MHTERISDQIHSHRAPRAARKKSKDPSRGGDRGLRYASQGTRDALVGYLLPIPWAILRRQYLILVTFLQPIPSRGVGPCRRKSKLIEPFDPTAPGYVFWLVMLAIISFHQLVLHVR